MTTTKTLNIAITGLPNAGKSTLMNAFVGQKVAIVTPKAQTTRTKILGIVNQGDTQLVFMDTPGLLTPKKGLHKTMMKAAWEGIKMADYGLYLIDSKKPDLDNNERYLAQIAPKKIPYALVLNKVDVVEKTQLLELTQHFVKLYPFEAVFMISALRHQRLKDVLKHLKSKAVEGQWTYEEDTLTDVSDREFAAEITREKLMMGLEQEIPYDLKVETEAWEETAKTVKIAQVITVARDAHKRIVLGKAGAKIKAIGIAARKDLEHHLGKHIDLRLFVRVEENWQNK